MHATTAVQEAVDEGFAQGFNIEERDWLTGLLHLSLTDQDGDPHEKTVWSDNATFPGGGFPYYPNAEEEVRTMCTAAMQAVNCADGIFRVIVYTGNVDNGGHRINICVILILDYAGHRRDPGRTCYPKGVDRYYLPAGTVDPVECQLY